MVGGGDVGVVVVTPAAVPSPLLGEGEGALLRVGDPPAGMTAGLVVARPTTCGELPATGAVELEICGVTGWCGVASPFGVGAGTTRRALGGEAERKPGP